MHKTSAGTQFGPNDFSVERTMQTRKIMIYSKPEALNRI